MTSPIFTARNRIAIELTINNGEPTELFCEVIYPGSDPEVHSLGEENGIEDAGNGVYRYTFTPTDEQTGVYEYRWYGKDSQAIEFAIPDADVINKYRSFSVF